MFPPAFFNILKEPSIVQKQMIPQKKGLKLSFFAAEKLRAWHYQAHLQQKDIEKIVKIVQIQEAKKIKIILPIL